MAKQPKHPMQPVEWDGKGVVRFRKNALVRYLIDAGNISPNALAALPNIDDEDRAQLAQLIGYSVSGFGELSYVSDELYERAGEERDALLLQYPTDPKRSVRTKPPPPDNSQ